VAYRRSVPLQRWLVDRRAVLTGLESLHATAGRPAQAALAHAYVLRMTAEFQGFVRDLHDLAIDVLVGRSGARPVLRDLLIATATRGRALDRGNANVRALQADFSRLGLLSFNDAIGARQPRWPGHDRKMYGELLQLRNCLAHGNAGQLDELRVRGLVDTLGWAGDCLPVLDRIADALDRAVWEHLEQHVGPDPWR
jgi:hypothetical protein